MTFDPFAIIDAIASHAQRTGHFDAGVIKHEPKNAPGNGTSVAVWFQRARPSKRQSGLTTTSFAAVVSVRVHINMLREPQDEIDADALRAASALYNAYHGDLDLGGQVQTIDVFGIEGQDLALEAGYVTIGSTMYRVYTITLPVICIDVWDQVN